MLQTFPCPVGTISVSAEQLAHTSAVRQLEESLQVAQAKTALARALLYFVHNILEPNVYARVEREARVKAFAGEQLTWNQAKSLILWGRVQVDEFAVIFKCLQKKRPAGLHLTKWVQWCDLQQSELQALRVEFPDFAKLARRQMPREEKALFSAQVLKGTLKQLRTAAEALAPESFPVFHPRLLRGEAKLLTIFWDKSAEPPVRNVSNTANGNNNKARPAPSRARTSDNQQERRAQGSVSASGARSKPECRQFASGSCSYGDKVAMCWQVVVTHVACYMFTATVNLGGAIWLYIALCKYSVTQHLLRNCGRLMDSCKPFMLVARL